MEWEQSLRTETFYTLRDERKGTRAPNLAIIRKHKGERKWRLRMWSDAMGDFVELTKSTDLEALKVIGILNAQREN